MFIPAMINHVFEYRDCEWLTRSLPLILKRLRTLSLKAFSSSFIRWVSTNNVIPRMLKAVVITHANYAIPILWKQCVFWESLAILSHTSTQPYSFAVYLTLMIKLHRLLVFPEAVCARAGKWWIKKISRVSSYSSVLARNCRANL